jgi:signal transduction histidine kinase
MPDTEPHWIETYGRVALTGEPAYFENYSAALDRHFEVRAFRSASRQFVTIFQDVSERKRLEARILQSQKMESVGRLAGGVAHDFNNILGVIMGSAEMVLDDMGSVDPNRAAIEEIISASRRAASVTRQLLGFARRQTIAPTLIDLNDTVEGLLNMLRRLIGENVDLRWCPSRNPLPLYMDTSQIDQLLVNLCINARDAIDGTGRITIETDMKNLDEAYCADHPDATPGHFVLLEVSDDGCGMDHQTQAHLFEPFFTTKNVGKGTGLGLATVYGIVRQNKGFINVYSEPGEGSVFRIYLPRHTGNANDGAATERAGATIIAPGNGETILIVEDDIAILKVSRIMLERLGYQVLSAISPQAALQLAGKQDTRIDLLVTDVIMPGMNGRDLAAQLTATHPGLQTLFMSGYTADVIGHHGVLDPHMHFIQKPFSFPDLATTVQQILCG